MIKEQYRGQDDFTYGGSSEEAIVFISASKDDFQDLNTFLESMQSLSIPVDEFSKFTACDASKFAEAIRGYNEYLINPLDFPDPAIIACYELQLDYDERTLLAESENNFLVLQWSTSA